MSQAQETAGVQNRLQLAGRFMEAGQTDKALTLYTDLYKESPDEFVFRQYVNCLQELADYGQAEKVIRRRMATSPSPLLLKVDLAANFLKADQAKKAEAVFKDIVEKTDFMKSGVSIDELAQDIVKKTGRHDVAIAVYQKARSVECADAEDFPILILDEPTNGLDPVGIQELRDLIRSFPKQGITVIISSHILAEIEHVADEIGIINAGKLAYQSVLDHSVDHEPLFMDVIKKKGGAENDRIC